MTTVLAHILTSKRLLIIAVCESAGVGSLHHVATTEHMVRLRGWWGLCTQPSVSPLDFTFLFLLQMTLFAESE